MILKMTSKQMITGVLLCIASLIFSACAATQTITPTSVIPTLANATSTPLPSNTPSPPASTPSPASSVTLTITPSPTLSAIPTSVRTPTITPTPHPLSITTANAGQLTLLNVLGQGIPYDVSWSPDGRLLAVSGIRGLDFYAANSFEKLYSLDSPLDQFAFSPDGNLIAGFIDSEVHILDALTGDLVKVLPAEIDQILEIAYSPGGTWLAAIGSIKSEDYTVPNILQVWNASTGDSLYTRQYDGYMVGIDFSPDGRSLAVGTPEEVNLLNASNGELTLKRLAYTYEVAFLPDGNSIIFQNNDDQLIILDIRTGSNLRIIPAAGDGGFILSPDGLTVVIPYSWDEINRQRITQVWDVPHGQLLYTFESPSISSQQYAFRPDGSQLAWVNNDSISIYDMDNRQVIDTLEYTDFISMMSLELVGLTGGTVLAVGYDNGQVWLWDLATGEVLQKLVGIREWPGQVRFSPDGRFVAAITSYINAEESVDAWVWDATTGEVMGIFPCAGPMMSAFITGIQVSPDGQVTGVGCHTFTINLDETGRIQSEGVHELPLPDQFADERVFTINYSSDGRLIAAGGDEGSIFVWDHTTSQFLYYLPGHAHVCGDGGCAGVYDVTFSPYGYLLASTGYDGTLRLWDASTGQALRIVYRSAEGINHLSFTPDGRLLLASGSGGVIYVFGIPAP